MRGFAAWSDGVARLNEAIAPDVRFRVEVRTGPRGATGRVRVGRDTVGVLVVRDVDGSERQAACPLHAAAPGRAALLSLAACVADCAMVLGLGVRIYRSAARPETPTRAETP